VRNLVDMRRQAVGRLMETKERYTDHAEVAGCAHSPERRHTPTLALDLASQTVDRCDENARERLTQRLLECGESEARYEARSLRDRGIVLDIG
jgi:hypothetical protein